jgi:MFS family permease
LLAYTATDSTVLLLARSLQGASAIGATTQALLADYITDLRALQTAYYQIGIGIVLSFMLSFLIGPLFNPPALFFVATACCAGAGLILSYFLPPQPGLTAQQKSLVPAELPSVALVATMSVNAGLHFLQSLVIGSYQLVAQPGLYELSALFVLALVICLYPLKKRELSLSFYVAQFVALFFLCLVGYNLISYSEYQPLSFRVFCGMTFVLLLLLEASLPAQLRLTAAQDYPFWIGIYTTLQSLSIGLGALCLYYAAYCWALMATMAIVLMILLGSLFMMTRMTPPHIAHAHSLQ